MFYRKGFLAHLLAFLGSSSFPRHRTSSDPSSPKKKSQAQDYLVNTFLTVSFIRRLIIRRLENDRPSITPLDQFSPREVLRSLSSPQVIMVFIMFFMLGTILYGLANFLPSIVSQFGFSPNKTQLLSVGPFAGGFFCE
jgi:hypothetical protein